MSGRKGAPDCPICLESLDPPKRIFQCSEGHFLCETCRSNPAMKWCPTCRGPFVGRNIGMEQVLQEFQDRTDSPKDGGAEDAVSSLRRRLTIVQEDFKQLQHIAKQNEQTAQKVAELKDEHSSLRRQLTIVQEDSKQLQHIESKLLKIHLGCDMETPSQRMMGVEASNSLEDGGSSKASESVNEMHGIVNELHALARRRGLEIPKGVKKLGGLMDKQNKD